VVNQTMKRIKPLILILVTTIIGLNPSSVAKNSRTIDSLSARLQATLHDTDRVNSLNTLAWSLKYANPDTAVILSSEALTIAESNEWQIGMARSIGYLGTFNYLKGNYPLALEYLFKALSIDEKLSESSDPRIARVGKSGVAIRYSTIGIIYDEQSDYPRALEYYLKALRMNEALLAEYAGEREYEKGIAIVLGNIGVVYRNQRDFELALEYFHKALDMNNELGRKSGVAVNLGNIGSVYDNQDDFQNALKYYQEALEIEEELGNKFGVSRQLGNLGGIYKGQGDLPKAQEFTFKALQMAEELGDQNSVARHLGNLGAQYTDLSRFEEAVQTLKQAIALSKEVGVKEYLKYQYNYLYRAYEHLNEPALAFDAYKTYILYRDSISNEENTRSQTRTEMKYEYEKAELVKQQEEREARRVEQEARSRRDNLQYSVILIAILSLFGGILALGFINVSERMAEGIIFFSFLILFEFLLVLADPYIDGWSGGAPGIKLLFNAGIAALIFPAHAFFESRLKSRLVKSNGNPSL